MDWEPTATTKVAKTGREPLKRAKWVSKEEIEERRRNRRCFRCGKEGHRIDQCSLLPAQKPTKVKKTRTKDNATDSEPESSSESTTNSSTEQLKD